MALGPRLDIRQSQSLVLTPQLTQAIRLLQLSNMELEAVIAEEMAKNPLLEASSVEDDGGAPVGIAGDHLRRRSTLAKSRPNPARTS